MKRFAIALAAVISTSAIAWGEREQGVVQGIAGTLILQHMLNNGQLHIQQGTHVPQQPPAHYRQPGLRPDWGQHHPHPQAVYTRPRGQCPWGTQEYFVRAWDTYGNVHYVFQGCR